ncbi:hypothetical protein AB8Z38_06750 [Bradyrhizobium sp. LLZ17]|uniref:Uncharacterized protein n=1 Tax=Bradyrhizobium sp. LLZ17 TaxID=3239388 RepID=A0AB39XQK3_9BRAD
MPDEEESPDELTIEDAAEKLSDSNTPESEIVTHIAGADLPDNMSMTVEQASKSLSDARTAEDAEAERLKADQIRKEVDELRGDKPADDQPKETKAENQPADSNDLPIHDDPDIAKALSKPKFVEAIKAYDNQVQQQVTQAVEQANDFARMSFAENFPEISNLPPQQWEGALIAMAQQEPERFKSAINSLNRVSQLQAARQQQQVQQQQREQVEFQHYAKAEDARFAELVKDEPPARLREIEAEIPEDAFGAWR